MPRRSVLSRLLRGVVIGLILGGGSVYLLDRAGMPLLPAWLSSRSGPAATATATPYPSLDGPTAAQVVAATLPERYEKLFAALKLQGTEVAPGVWRVRWGAAEWEVDGRTRKVTPLTDDARFFSGLKR